MSDKKLFDVDLIDDDEISEETLEELNNGKGDDEDE